MIHRCRTAIRRFSGFPAVFLPRLQFGRMVAYNALIVNDFPVAGEPRKIFFPEFPGAAGKGSGRRIVGYMPAATSRSSGVQAGSSNTLAGQGRP